MTADPSSASRARWLMIGLAFWATLINYLDRLTLSVAAPVLRDEFGMTNTQYGRVVLLFMVAYTIMNGLSGPLIDRLGTRVGYALCVAWWSGAAVLHGCATGVWSLAAYRFLLGVGEAGNWPAAVKLVAEWFPDKERGLASGIFNSGSAVGAIVAPPIVAWILVSYGWRTAFVAVGLIGFVWLLVWWPVYRTPPHAKAEATARPIPVRQLLRNRFVWTFTLSKFFLDPGWYFYTFWFPEYLKRERGFDMKAIGLIAAIPFAVAALGNLGGALSGYFIGRGMSVTVGRKLAVTIFAVLMSAGIPAVMVTNTTLSIALVSLALVGYTGCTSNMLAIPADVFPKSTVGSIWGLASMGSGFGGMLFAEMTGRMLDRYSYTPVFVVFGIIPLISAAILWTLVGPLTRSAGNVSSGPGDAPPALRSVPVR